MGSAHNSFSALMSIYDGESPQRFYASLQSLLEQEREADEVVVVKDGPINSALEEVLLAFESLLPIRIVSIENNLGLAGALNEGLKACSHSLVARMDTDDIALPERFHSQLKFIEDNPEVDVVGTWALDVDESGSVVRTRKVPVAHENIISLIWSCPFIHPTVLFRREKILAIGAYSSDAYRAEDYDLWFRAAQQGLVFANIPKPLIKYTVKRQQSWFCSVKQGWHRTRVGWINASKSKLPFKAYLGASCFLFKGIVPLFLQKTISFMFFAVDPRVK